MNPNKDTNRCNNNIMYVAWDTETTGLPGTRITPTAKNLHKYDSCRIVSLAAVKYSSRGRELASFHRIIKPVGYTVGATHVHGITHEHALEHGTPFTEVFREFIDFVGSVDTLVAHNSRFDENVLISEVLRIGQVPDFAKFNFVCTNNLHKEREFSPIKLIDLYTKIFGHGFDGAHDALNDARACGEVYPLMRDVERVHRPLVGVAKVIIKASDVSSIMGLSQFKKAPDVLQELWSKHLPDTCTMKSKGERAIEVIDACPVLQDIQRKAESTRDVAVLDEVEAVDAITPAQKGLVKDHLRNTAIYVRHKGASSTTSGEFQHYNVCCIKGTLYQIVGRVDRLRPNEDGTYTLVEMKQRTKGLFNRLRDYEEVQCRVYMAMMPAYVKDCLLVESYQGEMRSYLVQRDIEKWKTIAKRVHDFCSYFHHVVS
jgi:DNA polymerase III epsilon subunit-like protein